MIRVPTYIKEYSDLIEGEYLSVEIKPKKDDAFEIYYYGELFQGNNLPNPYITDFYQNEELVPCKVVAREINSGIEVLLFDGYSYGYNAMFCDEYDKEKIQNRTLVKYDFLSSKIDIHFGYSIDYDEEKEDYDIDDNGNVKLINGETISWEDVKRNGFDYISIECTSENGEKREILSLELA